jgi:hypothetical protein
MCLCLSSFLSSFVFGRLETRIIKIHFLENFFQFFIRPLYILITIINERVEIAMAGLSLVRDKY